MEIPKLHLFNVTTDYLYFEKGLSVQAYKYENNYWNGWEIPFFTKEQLDNYFKVSEILENIYVFVKETKENKDNKYLIWKDEHQRHLEKCKDLDLINGCHCNLTIIYKTVINNIDYYNIEGFCFYDNDEEDF